MEKGKENFGIDKKTKSGVELMTKYYCPICKKLVKFTTLVMSNISMFRCCGKVVMIKDVVIA